MRLFSSNRLEQLLDLLAALVSRPLPPLQAEVILVQSPGMAHWLSMGLSQHLGVWANAKFPFPLAFLHDVQKACGIKQDSRAWSPESLPWVTWQVLEQHQHHPAFAVLGQYLEQNQDANSRFQLAKRIANSFDEYMVYRPELLLSWDAGAETDNWQALLWRALVAKIAVPHRAQLQRQILNALEAGDVDVSLLPSRLSIFGISALPPIYIEILVQLGRYIEINLLLMNPCEEYWGDILSNYELAHQQRNRVQNNEDLHLKQSNALLASLGRVGRDFLELLYQYDLPSMSAYQASGEKHLLAHIQNHILTLQPSDDKPRIAPNDRSIQLHNCHSPMREIEVLYDQLLALFAANPDLNPSDVLVMAPEIESYAPLIQAVFSNTDNAYLPFSIADKTLRGDSVLFDSFMQLLALPSSRLTVSEVLSLLETPAIQAKFDIQESDFSLLGSWLENANIRWGIDADNRQMLDLPAFDEYSWQQGLERLLLGYALPDNSAQMQDFAGIMPLDLIEGQDSCLLGKLLHYLDVLFQYFHGLQNERTAADWLLYLEQMLSDLYQSDTNNQANLQQLRYGLQLLYEQQQQVNFNQKIPLNIVAAWFEQQLAKKLPAQGFMTGKLTFGSLLPMRSIPFKVICLLGMNDRDFPRNFRAPSFDIIAAHPHKGDRVRRHDDRYLFLEALLSARDNFYVSYIGQNIQDNKVMQASTVVAVLQQYIDDHYSAGTLSQLSQQHPLQAFHPTYFEVNSPFFSYREPICQAGRALQNPDKHTPNFLGNALAPHASLSEGMIDLRQIQHFYKHPSRYFLQHCLALQTDLRLSRFEDQEPQDLDPLSAFKLKQQLLERELQGQNSSQRQRWAYSDGKLPPAALSASFYQNYSTELQALFEKIAEKQQQPLLPAINTQLQIGAWRLNGTLDAIYADGLLRYHPAKSKLKHLLDVWLQHLFLNACAPPDYPRQTHLFFQDKSFILQAIDNSTEQILALIKHFEQGHCQPLIYFPDSSNSYWEARFQQQKDPLVALKIANKTWRYQRFSGGGAEALDNIHLRCFAAQALEGKFGEAFMNMCEEMLTPLAKVLEEI